MFRLFAAKTKTSDLSTGRKYSIHNCLRPCLSAKAYENIGLGLATWLSYHFSSITVAGQRRICTGLRISPV